MNIIQSKTKKSIRDYWQTPEWLVEQVAYILNIKFVLDPCANEGNSKGWLYIDEEMDGLKTNWIPFIFDSYGVPFVISPAAWVNPPFSQLDEWVNKIIAESKQGLTVCLIHPDTPDPAWYQKIEKHCFLQLVPTSRINFIDPETGKEKTGVNFPSCISVFNGFPKTNIQRIRFDCQNRRKSDAAA